MWTSNSDYGTIELVEIGARAVAEQSKGEMALAGPLRMIRERGRILDAPAERHCAGLAGSVGTGGKAPTCKMQDVTPYPMNANVSAVKMPSIRFDPSLVTPSGFMFPTGVSVAWQAVPGTVVAAQGTMACTTITGMGGIANFARGDGGRGPRRKPGKLGEFKSRDALRAENRMARSAAREAGLNSRSQQRVLHDEISGKGLSYQEILDIAKQMKAGEYW